LKSIGSEEAKIMNIARKPPCRLDFVFAAKAPVAVILRRGPTRSVKMILWHTNTDRFEDGEWWRGRIYEDKCGLSPDGRLFVYFGYQWKPRYIPEGVFAFTAVSRPPNFKPIALWPAGDTWGGGGCFLENRRLSLNYGEGAMPDVHPLFRPQGFQVEASPGTYCWPRPDAAFRLDPAEYPAADWLGKDHKGGLVFTRAGVLYRVTKKQECLVRDFNPDCPS
jgi:hypothetical protein